MRLKYEKVIHHAIVNNLFGFGYTKKSCNAQGSSKYYLFVTAPFRWEYTKKSCSAQGSSKYYLFVTAPFLRLLPSLFPRRKEVLILWTFPDILFMICLINIMHQDPYNSPVLYSSSSSMDL